MAPDQAIRLGHGSRNVAVRSIVPDRGKRFGKSSSNDPEQCMTSPATNSFRKQRPTTRTKSIHKGPSRARSMTELPRSASATTSSEGAGFVNTAADAARRVQSRRGKHDHHAQKECPRTVLMCGPVAILTFTHDLPKSVKCRRRHGCRTTLRATGSGGMLTSKHRRQSETADCCSGPFASNRTMNRSSCSIRSGSVPLCSRIPLMIFRGIPNPICSRYR